MIKVTAALIERNGKILIARRHANGPFGMKWEFPGGKVEEGETPEECLERELHEELAIQAKVGAFFGASRYDYGHLEVELLVYRVFQFSGEPRLHDHEEIRWVLPHDLLKYDFPEADRPIIRKRLEEEADS